MGPRLFAALGASRLQTTICTAAAGAALRATYGGSVGMDPEDFEYAQLVILWGANLLSTNLHQWRFVLEAQRRGAHVVAIDPLRTDTAERCDEHLAPRPGTDAALALGLMRVVLDEGAEDREWLARYSVGWPELEARLAEWPVERAAEICGLAGRERRRARASGSRTRGRRRSASASGLQRHGGAGAAMRAILALPGVTGDWRHVGGGVLCMTGGHFGGIDAGRVRGARRPARAARAHDQHVAPRRGAARRPDDPPVAALVVFDANPAASNPDHTRVHAGPRARGPLHRRARAAADRHGALRRHRPAGDHAARAPRPARLLRAPLRHAQPARRPSRRASACRTARSSAGWRRALGLDHPRLRESDEEIVRDVLDCDGRARGRHHVRAAARRGRPARRPSPGLAPLRRRRLPDAERAAAPARARARGAGRRSARRLRAAARARGRASSPSATRWRCSRPPAASSSTRRSPRCPGTAAGWARRACTCTRDDAGDARHRRAARACASTTTAARSPPRP